MILAMNPYDDRTADAYRTTLLRFARGFRIGDAAAQDAVSDAVLRLLRHRERYRHLPDADLLRIGQRTVARIVRDRRRSPRPLQSQPAVPGGDDAEDRFPSACPSPFDPLVQADAWRAFAEDAADLPHAATVLPAIRLFVQDDLLWVEAAARCGMTPSCLKHRLAAFREAWRARHDPSAL